MEFDFVFKHGLVFFMNNIFMNLFKFVTFYMHINVLSPRTVYISCQILFFFHLKMMTWSHRNVV